MFPSVNTDITTLGLPKNCEVAMVTYKYCIPIFKKKKNTVFVHFKKNIIQKKII